MTAADPTFSHYERTSSIMLRRTDDMLRETEHRRDYVKTKAFRFMLVAFIIGGAASPVMGQNQYSVYSVHDLGTLGGSSGSQPNGINGAGQVVGYAFINSSRFVNHAFRTAANRPINPATDDLGSLGGNFSSAVGINGTGQVVGFSTTGSGATHAFRTAANRPINPATDDLGSLGGNSLATAVSTSGQVVGYSFVNSANRFYYHAFRTAASGPINPAADDLGAVGPASVASSRATGINSSGQVVGYSQTNTGAIHDFLYSSGVIDDLNDLIPANSGWVLQVAYGINNAGQIIGCGI